MSCLGTNPAVQISIRRASVAICLFLGSGETLPAAEDQPQFSAEQLEFFEKEVRPIFVEHCHKCHGPDEQEGGLRLDARSSILKGGDTGPAIAPGKPDESELILAISYDPDGYQMPPDGKLPDELIATLTKWVEIGAPWPDEEAIESAGDEFNLEERAEYWSFQPLSHPLPPQTQDADWPRTPVDRFLLARLEEAGLKPAAETDRRTWIRRASLDVIGLPPTPEEVQAFVEDDSPAAFQTVVDRLLASPHYGERWGRHWLDLVRYAESRGHEFDYDVANPWHYRDYVIRALNDDVPYDRFVVEHVAGDLLKSAEELAREAHGLQPVGVGYPLRLHPQTGANESIVATGFWFFGEWVHSPVDIRQEEADRFENMIDVYAKTFLGLTVACARCHDHKFDPITQKDYYALQGYLQSSSYRQARFETMEHNRRIAEELEELRRSALPHLLQAYREAATPVTEKFDKYLQVSLTAIELGPELKPESKQIVFEDFESGTYDGWEATGDAFGDSPQTQETIAGYLGDVKAEGKFFVNSHQKRAGGQGDNHVGTLTSPEFTIERNFIRLLVGGGSHAGKTCVNLLIDGQPVLSATGKNNNEMAPFVWDVTEHRGETARIQVVDNERGGWGNIGVDQIVFTNQPTDGHSLVEPAQLTDEFQKQVRELAQKDELDGDRVLAWVAFLMTPERYQHDPMLAWLSEPVQAVQGGEEVLRNFIAEEAVRDLMAEEEAAASIAADRWIDNADEIATYFEGQSLDLADGVVFGIRGAELGDIRLSDDPSRPIDRIFPDSAAERDPTWDVLQPTADSRDDVGRIQGWQRGGRLLRTPTFDITKGRIWALVYGGCNTYVAVDSHIVINGPLHASLTKQHPTLEEWRWIEHDVTRYRGHRAHVEFVPSGDAPLRIKAIVQSDTPPPPEAVEVVTPDSSRTLFRAAVYLKDFDVVAPASEFGPIVALWFQFMIDHPQLFGLETEAARQRLSEASTPFIERRRELVSQIRPVSHTTPAMLDGSGEDEYVFIRGAWKKRGETVPRRFLEVFNGHGPADIEPSATSHQPSADPGSGRLELALQMVDPQQTPILPRVIVNRIWQHYFGRGIVSTPDDFGHMGQLPSHPELLDWLAGELVGGDWSLKHVHRLILLSSAYRMQSAIDDSDDSTVSLDRRPSTLDPNNILLHRMNIKRLEGEIIRDQVLTVSGRLDEQLYGRSVPVHLTPFMEGRGRPGESGPVDGRGRRSLYTSVRRNFPDPFYQAFDFPNPHTTIGRRSVSNVPAQALALMNNPFIVEQSRVWADRLLAEMPDGSDAERVTRLYESAFSRSPTEEELTAGELFVKSQADEYNTNTSDPRVWADYCHVLVNVKEFVFVQ